MPSRLISTTALLSLSLFLVACQSTAPNLEFKGNEGEVYSFTATGLGENEMITPQDVAVGFGDDEPMALLVSAETPKDGESTIQVTFNGNEPMGTWNITVKGSEAFEATSSFEYAPTAPRLNLVSVETRADGYTNYVFFGSGFQAGENLVFTTQGPDSPSQEVPFGTASEQGYSTTIPVPFVENPTDGTYTFTLTGDVSGTTEYNLVCSENVCE